MARLGIVGFPNTGKTSLFNALTGLDAPTAPHPYTTTEPNVGVAQVADPLLDEAGRLEGSAKVVHATLELIDLPALARGGGMGAAHLGRLREMEALVAVLRAFEDPAVPAGESGLDPATQAEELALELVIADSEVFERRKGKMAKEATADPAKRAAAQAVGEAAEYLAQGSPLRTRSWSEEALRAFRDSAPLTLKPSVWVVNVGEEEPDSDARASVVRSLAPAGDVVVALSCRLEQEGSRLDPAERVELFAELGMGEGALATMVRAARQALGLVTFYTLGPKEARAWTVPRGATAPEAAGRIHSDMERGFIRAEVAPLGSVVEAGGWEAAKRANLVTVEGKDYVVREGDTVHVRFSV